ncbi:hypothetical protein HK101_007339 [Irineochytrium annulatum]|nr:hypothetical protein HK101_007339 [Irineochytrium annulatum]
MSKAGRHQMDDELRDLKLRFDLLEGDRKAYYETSQWAIRTNKEDISRLRSQNKDLSEAVGRLKKNETDAQNRLALTELERLDYRICEIHRKHDELQAEAKRKDASLRKKRDLLEGLKREAEAVKSNVQNSSQAKEVRMLQNRLDKGMIKFNEAHSIRKTYEHIVERLQEERLSFHGQLATFEKTLKAKKQDLLDLETMSRDANLAKELAKAELAKFEQQLNEDRKFREKDLHARRAMVKQKVEVHDKMIDAKSSRLGDPNADVGSNAAMNYDESKDKKMAEYEETMRLIKEATGFSDINEVIAKFQSQGDTHNHLVKLQEQHEARLEELTKKRIEVLANFEELKYSGESRTLHSERMIDGFHQHLGEAGARVQESKHKYDRVAKLMADTQAGIKHLCDKLDLIQLPEESAKMQMGDDTVKQILETCVAKLDMMGKNLQGKELPEPIQSTPTQQLPAEPVGILQKTAHVLPTYNTRVKLRPAEFEVTLSEDEDDNGEDSTEVPDRNSIKKRINQLLNAQVKTGPHKKHKKKKVGVVAIEFPLKLSDRRWRHRFVDTDSFTKHPVHLLQSVSGHADMLMDMQTLSVTPELEKEITMEEAAVAVAVAVSPMIANGDTGVVSPLHREVRAVTRSIFKGGVGLTDVVDGRRSLAASVKVKMEADESLLPTAAEEDAVMDENVASGSGTSAKSAGDHIGSNASDAGTANDIHDDDMEFDTACSSQVENFFAIIRTRGLDQGMYTDVRVRAFDLDYQLHRIILITNPYMSSLLLSAPSDADVLVIPPSSLKLVTPSAFEIILGRVYGRQDIPEEAWHDIPSLMAAATVFSDPDLYAQCLARLTAATSDTGGSTPQQRQELVCMLRFSEAMARDGDPANRRIRAQVMNACVSMICSMGGGNGEGGDGDTEIKEILTRLPVTWLEKLAASDCLHVARGEFGRYSLIRDVIVARRRARQERRARSPGASRPSSPRLDDPDDQIDELKVLAGEIRVLSHAVGYMHLTPAEILAVKREADVPGDLPGNIALDVMQLVHSVTSASVEETTLDARLRTARSLGFSEGELESAKRLHWIAGYYPLSDNPADVLASLEKIPLTFPPYRCYQQLPSGKEWIGSDLIKMDAFFYAGSAWTIQLRSYPDDDRLGCFINRSKSDSMPYTDPREAIIARYRVVILCGPKGHCDTWGEVDERLHEVIHENANLPIRFTVSVELE